MTARARHGHRPPVGTGRDLPRLIAMMGLFFLVVCAVGILRPIKNALALDGLGDTDFYKVYLVSAAVVLFVPLYNRLADRLSWRWLIPAVSLFFALHLLGFRLLYVEGSTAFGLAFYGWYDLFAAALVTQFFMATQLFFDARMARRAYPLVIAGGSIGATLGGAITGFFAQRLGTPNLMLVAAALIAAFSVGMPFVWRVARDEQPQRRMLGSAARLRAGEMRTLLAHPQVRLIAGMVLITILVKQLVDYQFNTLSKDVFESRDAISAFQGKFNAATQWLPLVVLAVLQPLLKRWGVGLTVLLLPAAMLLTNAGLVLFWGVGMVVAAKGAETTLRYSAERAGREILYVPVPEEIKLRAKAYIDVAIEKGIGKVASAALIFALLQVMSYRSVALVATGLSLAWLVMAVRVKAEYIRSLERSIEGRFASLRGVFASLADATTLPVVRRGLAGDEAQISFTLDLLEQGKPSDASVLAAELHDLTANTSARIRRRALQLLARSGNGIDAERVRPLLLDDNVDVREAAVRALHAGSSAGLIDELLASEHAVIRTAALTCAARGELGLSAVDAARRVYAGRWSESPSGTPAERLELALAAGVAHPESAAMSLVIPLLDDPDPLVASTALRTAGRFADVAVYPQLIAALGRTATREAARDGLVRQGERAVPALRAALLDLDVEPAVRRNVPAVLSRIASPDSVTALVKGALADETDQLLDHRAIRALSKLRAHHPQLPFDATLVNELIDRQTSVTRSLREAAAALGQLETPGPAATMLRRAIAEAAEERCEGVFRCLGLLFPPDAVYRCYSALANGDRTARANALEWLEQTTGHTLFATLAPVLAERATPGGRRRDTARLLAHLSTDQDAWIACCSARAALELTPKHDDPDPARSTTMDLLDKVFLLQRVDLLQDAKSAHLALLASIADVIDVAPDTVLIRRDEPVAALYVVINGAARLSGQGSELIAGEGMAFGTWALIDEAPAVVDAITTKPSRLLRIGRDDFYDLLSDHPELAIGLLQGLARRVRALVA